MRGDQDGRTVDLSQNPNEVNDNSTLAKIGRPHS